MPVRMACWLAGWLAVDWVCAMHAVQVGEATVAFRPEWDRHRLTPRHTAYLRVAEGCSHACSFCAIPGFRWGAACRCCRCCWCLLAVGVLLLPLLPAAASAACCWLSGWSCRAKPSKFGLHGSVAPRNEKHMAAGWVQLQRATLTQRRRPSRPQPHLQPAASPPPTHPPPQHTRASW